MTAAPPFDRLVAKETSLGTLREIPIPNTHIGIATIAPLENVQSDDVIFDFLEDSLQEGLAPARAQDAESELAQKDDFATTSGRARLIDWSLKNTYDAGKVMSYRDSLRAQQALSGLNGLQVNTGLFDAPIAQFRNKVARDDAWRLSRLQNRLEWLVMTAFETSLLAYADGKINFAIDYKRPAGQQNQAPASGVLWNDVAADPIGDIRAMNRFMSDTYGLEMKEAYCSKYAIRDLFRITRFIALVGLVVGGAPSSPIDLDYLRPDFNEEAAIAVIERATGVKFIPYDGFYRSRTLGTNNTGTNVRYTSSKKIIFKPSAADLAQVDPDGMGFAKTLTSPHPEGNWTPGFYEWEKDRTDPWGTDRGTGIKAFPIFPFMKYSYVMTVLP